METIVLVFDWFIMRRIQHGWLFAAQRSEILIFNIKILQNYSTRLLDIGIKYAHPSTKSETCDEVTTVPSLLES